MSWSSSKSTTSTQPIGQPSLPQVIINTRPVERAAPLTQHLQAAGMSVIDMPMLTLEACPTTEQDMTLMRQWLAGDYQALVIVSPTAAASGLAVWQKLEQERQIQKSDGNDKAQNSPNFKHLKAPSHLIAVGEATAAVLNDAKLDAKSYRVLQPLIANNEGMLAMPEIESLKAGDKMLVWRGLGGRRLLVNTLQARGVHIDSIAWYERKMPSDAMARYEKWKAEFLAQKSEQQTTSGSQPKPVVIVSSGTAFEHWQAIVSAVAEQKVESSLNMDKPASLTLKLTDFAYVVLGERLANMVAEQDLSYWRVEDLAPGTILAAIHSPIVG
ncbi:MULTISPECIES: uroporphyrinogen-III synthase [unclassified Psychrobacter]|uniref:uroporphyrinogen-III synthase n=1 Tax=unclassified Psychrobacter TaxID=196806 RepID=UPI0025D49974|nr:MULTISPECIES: uroporphyrinogen-III synthase [unclassified Psychrobacter]